MPEQHPIEGAKYTYQGGTLYYQTSADKEPVAVMPQPALIAVVSKDSSGDPAVVKMQFADGRQFTVTTAETGGSLGMIPSPQLPGAPTSAALPPLTGFHPIQSHSGASAGRWFYEPDDPASFKNPNPDKYEWIQQTVPDPANRIWAPEVGQYIPGEKMGWVLTEKALTKKEGTIRPGEQFGLPVGTFVITDPDGNRRIWTPEKAPGKKGYKDQAVADAVAKALGPDYRAIQLPDESWDVVLGQAAEKKGLAEPEFRQDKQGQTWVRTSPEGAWQRYEAPSLEDMETQKLLEGRIEEARAYRNFRLSPTPEAAMRLALDIQKSPGDWWTYLGMLYGDQANKPYTGAQAVPRTWATQLAGMLGLQLPGEVPQFGAGAGAGVPTVPPGFGGATVTVPPRAGAGAPGGGGMLGAGGLLPGQIVVRSPTGQLQARDSGWPLPSGYVELDPLTSNVIRSGPPLETAPVAGAGAGVGELPPLTGPGGMPYAEWVARAGPGAEIASEPPRAEMEQAEFPLNTPVAADAEAAERERARLRHLEEAVGAAEWERKMKEEEESGVGIPLMDSPSEAPFALPAIRFQAQKGKELAIINEGEIPSFVDAGYRVTKKVKLYDGAMPLFGPVSGMAPNWGIRRALTGQVVNRGRPLPTIGAPVFPSAQSWANLAPSEQSMFTSEVQRIGIPIEDYLAQWRATMPSWNTSGTFRRVPSFLGPVA